MLIDLKILPLVTPGSARCVTSVKPMLLSTSAWLTEAATARGRPATVLCPFFGTSSFCSWIHHSGICDCCLATSGGISRSLYLLYFSIHLLRTLLRKMQGYLCIANFSRGAPTGSDNAYSTTSMRSDNKTESPRLRLYAALATSDTIDVSPSPAKGKGTNCPASSAPRLPSASPASSETRGTLRL